MRASGHKLVKFCTLIHTYTHTHAAKLVVQIKKSNPVNRDTMVVSYYFVRSDFE